MGSASAFDLGEDFLPSPRLLTAVLSLSRDPSVSRAGGRSGKQASTYSPTGGLKAFEGE
jgi:hypothetical protein